MKTPTKAESIAKLAQWCVENSSKTFSAFFEWSPHTHLVIVTVFKDGWRNGIDSDINEWIYPNDSSDAELVVIVDYFIVHLEGLLSESKQRNSPENAAKLQAERDAKELAAAKATIARLEGE